MRFVSAMLVCTAFAMPVMAQEVSVSANDGREFSDAVVPLEAVEAVLVRTK